MNRQQPQEQLLPRAPLVSAASRDRRNVSMSRFKAINYAATAGADRDLVIQEYPVDRVVSLYVPDGVQYTSRVFMYCMELIQIISEEDIHDLLGLYASAICTVFRGAERFVVDALKQIGIGVEMVWLPSQAAQNNVLLPEKGDFSAVLVMTGQLLLLPFKNINVVSYENFMMRRAQALRAHTGCYVVANVTVYLTQRKAEIVKAGIGSVLSFKIGLLNSIKSEGSGVIRNMCNYLLNIIAWSDMGALVSIRDTLLVSNSPVLRDSRVASEVLNLGRAFREVCKFKQPQFFRILGDPHLHHLLNKNNFPILHAVASCLRSETTRSVNQFVPAISRENALVKELCEMHKAVNPVVQDGKYRQYIAFLTTFNDDEMLEL